MAAQPDERSLLIVGGGRMGEALLGGLLAAGRAAAELAVAEVSAARREELAAAFPDVEIVEAAVAADGAVLVVKPGDVPAGRARRRRRGRSAHPVGGRRCHHRRDRGGGRPAAPRRPRDAQHAGAVRAGAAAISPGSSAGEDDLAWAEEILGAVGVVVRVPEKALDAVTGLSGSGPAYVFLVAEAMAEAGVLAGLSRDVAETLAFQTLLGAAQLLVEGDDGPASLRAAVTSPGGTTAAGLRELERHGVRAAFLEAVTAAAERSRELGA